MPSTIAANDVINYARAHTQLRPLLGIGGVSNEPGLSICNDLLQVLFSRPFAWKFNRNVMSPFVTQPFVQDYFFAGACAFATSSLTSGGVVSSWGGGAGIDLAANTAISASGQTVTVVTLQPHNFAVGMTVFLSGVTDQNGNLLSGWNSTLSVSPSTQTSTWTNGYTITAVPTATSFQFTYSGTVPTTPAGSPGITNFGWMQAAILTDTTSTVAPQPQGPLDAVDTLTPTNTCGDPDKVAMISDNQQGVLTFRIYPNSGSKIWQITPIYQARPSLLASPTAKFTPWPDNLAYVLRQGMIAYAYRLSDKPQQAEAEFQRFNGVIMQAQAYMDLEDQLNGVAPSAGIMRG